ncbi:hypothetical protein [Haladaptatus sp. AB643]|uniref:hypothetical protein n=1 Tax=Haladaptatus sp. AB643 TaxID=2934174 RepID=UPI00209C401A|nr:hypothetical protein [Haladaptatus sp. AB643]MCO8242969.1 hypothetical protein [Haladaptatus sp. AB643]
MTDLVPVGPDSGNGRNQSGIETKPFTWMSMNSDEYVPIEETRRTADVRSPLIGEYDFPTILDEVLGRESATCEACQETVHHPDGGDLADGEPFVLRELVENIYTVENQVLLCATCANRPTAAWQANVRTKRAQERDYTPNWRDYLAHWVSDPTAISLFARRVVAGLLGVTALVTLAATVAGIAGSLTADVVTGWHWAITVVMAEGFIVGALTVHPWVVGTLVSIAYVVHAVERLRHDPRGYCARQHRPWLVLTLAGLTAGGSAFSLVGIATGVVPATMLARLLAAVVWMIGAAGVAWYIDLAVRHDLAIGIWYPNRGLWIIAGRIGLLPGLLALTAGVPFSGVVAPTATGILAAIPAAVAFAFAGLRLPYDSRTRDSILDLVPEWVLSALTIEHRRE